MTVNYRNKKLLFLEFKYRKNLLSYSSNLLSYHSNLLSFQGNFNFTKITGNLTYNDSKLPQ